MSRGTAPALSPEQLKLVDEVLHAALARSAGERREFVRERCGGDEAVHGEVVALLEQLDQSGGSDVLPAPARLPDSEIARELIAAAPLEPGEQIGPYVIREVLGEGGFALVYLAQQHKPIRRQVALKIIKLGMDTREVLARFEAERQALALMEHPSVAKIFDVGATEAGRPYFVMEYVPGIPITLHCDQLRLPIRDRLRVFIQVCEAVQHAHQKGIIHRDIKPSNVLVEVEQGNPLVKIIDFGIAKAIDQRLTERTIFTQRGDFIGTPEYMSPEQAHGSAQHTDTRSDIYSLGVLLYELLTGNLPFDRDRLRKAAVDEIQRIVRDEDPPQPSTKIGHLGERSSDIAGRRQTDARTLYRHLRGELDWITMKAMDKDRTRRYQSASEFAADIKRRLADEPVLAGPPTTFYRLGKLIKRHRGAAAAVFAVVLTLTAALVTSLVMYAQVTRAKEVTQTVLSFVLSILAEADPYQTSGGEVSIGEALRRASERLELETELSDQPRARAAIRSAIGMAYLNLGLLDDAKPHLQAALETRQGLFGSDHLDVAKSMSNLGKLFHAKAEYERANPLFIEALSIRKRILGDKHLLVAASLQDAAWFVFGRLPESEAWLRQALAMRRQSLSPNDPLIADTLTKLAHVLSYSYGYRQGKYGEAEALLSEAVKIQHASLRPDHPTLAYTLFELGDVRLYQREYEGALSAHEDALVIREKVFGKDHPDVMWSLHSLAWLRFEQYRNDEGEALLNEALKIAHTLDIGHHDRITVDSVQNLALLLEARGDYELAERLYRAWLNLESKLGDDRQRAISLTHLASFLVRVKGDHLQAEPLLRNALEILESDSSPDGVGILAYPKNLRAVSLQASGDFAGAEAQLLEVESMHGNLVDDRPGINGALIATRSTRVVLLYETGRADEASPLCDDVLKEWTNVGGPTWGWVGRSLLRLAAFLRAQERYDAAEQLYRTYLTTAYLHPHPARASVQHDLAELLVLKGDFTAAETEFVEALGVRRLVLHHNHADLGETLLALGRFLLRKGERGQFDAAEAYLLECHGILQEALGSENVKTVSVREALAALYDAWGVKKPIPGPGRD